jgi:hypothetical protein
MLADLSSYDTSGNVDSAQHSTYVSSIVTLNGKVREWRSSGSEEEREKRDAWSFELRRSCAARRPERSWPSPSAPSHLPVIA